MFKIEPVDLEFDANCDVPFRARSNTWPLPRPEINESFQDCDKADIDGSGLVNGGVDNGVKGTNSNVLDQTAGCQTGPKKNTSRRNAWGNMSYADLITQAINGSPEKRLTLSQIYDWMVQNVPYFKDKGDSNSSAGWKVSFQNLSLHNRLHLVAQKTGIVICDIN